MIKESKNSLTVDRIKQVLGLNKGKKAIGNKGKKGKKQIKLSSKVNVNKMLSKTKKRLQSLLKVSKDKKDKKVNKTKKVMNISKDKKGKKVIGMKGKKNYTMKAKKDYKSKKGTTKKTQSNKQRNKQSNKQRNKQSNKQSNKQTILSNPLCDTCIKVSKIKGQHGTMISANIEDWKEAKMHIPLLGESNKGKGQEVYINLGKQYANRLVYYFAAKSMNTKGVKKYSNVYINSKNNGLVVLDKDGKGVAKVDCPSVYLDVPPKTLVKKGKKLQAYMNHIHMIVSDKNMTKWEDKMFTQNVLCKISKSELELYNKIGLRVVLNALEPKYNIPGTDANMLYKNTAKLKGSQIRDYIRKIALNKSKMHKKILEKCNITNIPLIVYCHNPNCTAAKSLAEDLYRAGFYNILYYPDGFMGYHGRV